MMTPEQLRAIAHPCYFAFETPHPRFGSSHRLNQPPYSLVLTVNSGYE